MVLSVKGWLVEQDDATKQAFHDTYSPQRATVTESPEEDGQSKGRSPRDMEDAPSDLEG